MINLVRKLSSLYSKMLSLFVLFFLSTKAQAQSYNFAESSGLEKTADAAGFSSVLKGWTPEILAGSILSQILAWLSIAFIGMIIYGGIIWMIGEGDEAKATKAKNIITGAITGLIIVFLAYAISSFVISYFGNQTFN